MTADWPIYTNNLTPTRGDGGDRAERRSHSNVWLQAAWRATTRHPQGMRACLLRARGASDTGQHGAVTTSKCKSVQSVQDPKLPICHRLSPLSMATSRTCMPLHQRARACVAKRRSAGSLLGARVALRLASGLISLALHRSQENLRPPY